MKAQSKNKLFKDLFESLTVNNVVLEAPKPPINEFKPNTANNLGWKIISEFIHKTLFPKARRRRRKRQSLLIWWPMVTGFRRQEIQFHILSLPDLKLKLDLGSPIFWIYKATRELFSKGIKFTSSPGTDTDYGCSSQARFVGPAAILAGLVVAVCSRANSISPEAASV